MRTRFSIAAAIVTLSVAAAPFLRGTETDAGSMILHAHSVILDRSSSRDATKNALLEILDAALLILPNSGTAAECRSRIEVAKREFDEKSMFSDKGHQYLSLAYRLVADGKKWHVPEDIGAAYKSADIMEAARKAAQERIDGALSGLKAGRGEEAVRSLLDYVLMIVTPIEH